MCSTVFSQSTNFPSKPSATSFCVNVSGAWLEQRSRLSHAGVPEDGSPHHVEFGDDAEFESEIKTIVDALEPTEEKRREDKRKAQSKAEGVCTPTLDQHVNHKERSRTISCEVDWSHKVVKLSRSWSFQPKVPKETLPNAFK